MKVKNLLDAGYRMIGVQGSGRSGNRVFIEIGVICEICGLD
jgi:hypothetical protein